MLVARAEDVLRECQRQGKRAVAGRSGKELGVADAPRLQGTYQPLLDGFMSDYILKHVVS